MCSHGHVMQLFGHVGTPLMHRTDESVFETVFLFDKTAENLRLNSKFETFGRQDIANYTQ